jgi:arylsulfatase A-like enzyme
MAGMLKEFPRGIPHTGEDNYFRLEDGIDWLIAQLNKIPRPFAGYFHYLPPHRPYNTRREFVNQFAGDGLEPYLQKPSHPIFNSGNPQNPKYQGVQRQLYDEFILYVDAEFGRLYDSMQKSGLLENTWVVFTSDHGEMFERGIFGHKTPLLYEPVVRVPLLILEPGQSTRRDIHTPTSAVDVLPTLAHVTGQPVPSWTEGRLLPPFNDPSSAGENSVFALEASLSKEDQPLNPASLMLVKGDHKLAYYFGYEELEGIGPWFELYDLRNDPQELNNLYSESSGIFQELRDELMEKLEQVDRPYVKR